MFFTQFEFLFFLLLLFAILAVIKRNDLYKITILTASIFFLWVLGCSFFDIAVRIYRCQLFLRSVFFKKQQTGKSMPDMCNSIQHRDIRCF